MTQKVLIEVSVHCHRSVSGQYCKTCCSVPVNLSPFSSRKMKCAFESDVTCTPCRTPRAVPCPALIPKPGYTHGRLRYEPSVCSHEFDVPGTGLRAIKRVSTQRNPS